jgi:hypothetical protein
MTTRLYYVQWASKYATYATSRHLQSHNPVLRRLALVWIERCGPPEPGAVARRSNATMRQW